MLTYQPLVVGGIEVGLDRAKANAYGALFSFVVSFGVSVFYLIQDAARGGVSRRRQSSAHEYEGVPTNSSSIMSDYAMNLDLPRSVQEGTFT